MDVLDGGRCRRLLSESPFGALAVVADGRPYVTPVSFVRSGDALFFRSGPGLRTEALRADPTVCLSTVHFDEDGGSWESVIVRGAVEFIADEVVAAAVTALFVAKYRRYEPAIGIAVPEVGDSAAVTFVLPLDDMTGRSSGLTPAPRTRPGRL